MAGWIRDVPHRGIFDPYLTGAGVGVFRFSLLARKNVDRIDSLDDGGLSEASDRRFAERQRPGLSRISQVSLPGPGIQ